MARLTAEIMNGQRVVEVENADEFLAALTHRLDVDGLAIEAPPGVGESLGFDNEADGSE